MKYFPVVGNKAFNRRRVGNREKGTNREEKRERKMEERGGDGREGEVPFEKRRNDQEGATRKYKMERKYKMKGREGLPPF